MSSITVGDMIVYLQNFVDIHGDEVKDYQIYMDIVSGDKTAIAAINGMKIDKNWREVRLLN